MVKLSLEVVRHESRVCIRRAGDFFYPSGLGHPQHFLSISTKDFPNNVMPYVCTHLGEQRAVYPFACWSMRTTEEPFDPELYTIYRRWFPSMPEVPKSRVWYELHLPNRTVVLTEEEYQQCTA